MSIQIARLCKTFFADLALKWPFKGVSSNMNLQNVFPSKSLRAVITCKRPYICVLALEMVFQVSLSCEIFLTYIALKRLKTLMAVDVILKTCLFVIKLATPFWAIILLSGF